MTEMHSRLKQVFHCNYRHKFLQTPKRTATAVQSRPLHITHRALFAAASSRWKIATLYHIFLKRVKGAWKLKIKKEELKKPRKTICRRKAAGKSTVEAA
jgi:hypothetical protein